MIELTIPAIRRSLSNSSTLSGCFDEGREEAGGKSNYDESEDVDLGSAPPSSSAMLPVDADDEIDLYSDELAEILADVPI